MESNPEYFSIFLMSHYFSWTDHGGIKKIRIWLHKLILKCFFHSMAAEDISPLKDGGVLKEIIKEGYGDEVPSVGSKVTVHYTGTLLDGTKFDSSKDRDNPFQFSLGQGQVIKAWDIGVATMKKGEVAMLTCNSKYAYGKTGSPPKIPADATLKFEVIIQISYF